MDRACGNVWIFRKAENGWFTVRAPWKRLENERVAGPTWWLHSLCTDDNMVLLCSVGCSSLSSCVGIVRWANWLCHQRVQKRK